MNHFAVMPMPVLIVAWAATGLVAAYLAYSAMRGGRVYLVVDSIAGLVGATIGGLAAFLLNKDRPAVLGSMAAAFLCAWAVVIVARTVALQRRT